MGLDNFAFAESGIDLCGGMYSDGVTSFRGKVYDMFVMEVRGEFLIEEWLPPETVAQMAACDPDPLGSGSRAARPRRRLRAQSR